MVRKQDRCASGCRFFSHLAAFLVENRALRNFLHTGGWEPASIGCDAENDDRDVVGSAALQCCIHQLQAGFGRWFSQRDAGQFGLSHDAPESVGAKDEDIAHFEGYGPFRSMRDNLLARSERGGEDVALRMRLGIFGADDAAFHQPSNVGMIARKPRSRPGAKKVQAAVSNMGETELAFDNRKGGAGCTHPGELRMLGGEALNRLMGGAKSTYQSILRIIVKVAVIYEAHGFDRQTARLLSAFITAHSVGDHGQPAFQREFFVGIGLPVEARILVVDALAPDVSQARNFESGFGVDAINRHKREE